MSLSCTQSARRAVIVDDDRLFSNLLLENLSHAGFAAVAFDGGLSALAHLRNEATTDIILLDWKMPGMSGIDVLRKLRERKIGTPVVFLTSLNDQIYEEAGLLCGAVDFIEKTRSFPILMRRLELILNGKKRDVDVTVPGATSSHCNIELRRDSHRAFWKGAEIDLTVTEFRILEYLVMRTDQDVRYRELYDIVRGEGFAAGNGIIGFQVNVRALIKRIRQKIRRVDERFEQIENYPGFGYRWIGAG